MEKIKNKIRNGNGGFYIYFALYASQLLFLFSAVYSNVFLLGIGIAVDLLICSAWFKLNKEYGKNYGIVDFCRSLVLMGFFSLGFYWIGTMLNGWN